MSTLDNAIQMAVSAHSGQLDKGGQPYILHPLRVMLSVSGEVAQIVAVLHDVVEDTEIDLDDIGLAGFAPEVVAAIDAVTRRESEDYTTFINRVALNPIATAVKIADLNDNLDPNRLIPDAPKATFLRHRYTSALRILSAQEPQQC